MPFGAVFTSSDLGGGRIYTRLRGPLLLGYSTQDPGGQTMGITSTAPAGSAAQPLYSFFPRPDTGIYATNVTTSASDVRWSHAGIDFVSFTSGALQMVSTAAASSGIPRLVWANGFLSSVSNDGAVYIPQTTYAVSSSSGTSSGATPPALGSGVALIFDSLRNKLSVFSTVANQWLSVTLTSS